MTLEDTEVDTHVGASAVAVRQLRVEYGTVTAIGTDAPRLSWQIETDDPAWAATAYEIECARPDGRIERALVESGEQVLVPWPFSSLASRDRRVVRVRVASGATWTDFSEPVPIEVGLLDRSDWHAAMISPATLGGLDDGAPILFSDVPLEKPLARARLYVTAWGLYRFSINDAAITDHAMTPGWTSYQSRLQVQTYDVADLLRSGDNRLEAVLGNGWYRGQLVFPDNRSSYGDRLALLAQLEVEYTDGTTATFGSDESWRACRSGILSDDLYDGQRTDLRGRHLSSGTAPAESEPVQAVDLGATELVFSTAPPVRVTEVRRPAAVLRSPSNRLLVDFGQNLVGWVRLVVRDQLPGTEVSVRHAEVLEHGELGIRPLRSADATSSYLLAGEPLETLVPIFTFNGFRYAEIRGVDEDAIVEVEALVLGSDLDRTGWFACSEPLVERFHENVVWSTRGNFLSLPTDCPQRDERLGWTGDIQVFAPAASFLFDTAGFLRGWLRDLAVEQKPDGGVPYIVPDVLRAPDHAAAGWSDAAAIVPSVLFERFADQSMLVEQFPSMSRWVDKISSMAVDDLWTGGTQFGDWLDPTAPPEHAEMAQADPDVVATVYYARSAGLVARAAELLGLQEPAEHYRALESRVRAAFAAAFVAEDGRIVSDCQTVYALAIRWDMCGDATKRSGAERRLAELVRRSDHRVSTGFLGTPLVLDALCDSGEPELAYRMLLETGCPSWLYAVTMGATTVWERWDSMLPDGSINPGSMTSFNHYAYGAIIDWLHRRVAGLAPLDAGYRRVEIRPLITGQLRSASAEHDSPYGRVRVGWSLLDDVVQLEVVLPPGVTGELWMPGTAEPETLGHGRHERSGALRAGV